MAALTYTKPTVGGSEDSWGTTLNANWDALGTFIGALDSTELAVLDGITATTAELNILDGVTATAAEFNLLDGVPLTTDLSYVDGVTSPIQTQIDNIFSPPTQATAVWEAGTDTIESLVSAAKVAAAIAAQAVNVATETAALSVGSIGTYALLNYNSASPPIISAGGTTLGSNLRYAGAVTANYSGTSGPTATAIGTPSGTWRIMGRLDMSGGVQVNNASLFLRIS